MEYIKVLKFENYRKAIMGAALDLKVKISFDTYLVEVRGSEGALEEFLENLSKINPEYERTFDYFDSRTFNEGVYNYEELLANKGIYNYELVLGKGCEVLLADNAPLVPGLTRTELEELANKVCKSLNITPTEGDIIIKHLNEEIFEITMICDCPDTVNLILYKWEELAGHEDLKNCFCKPKRLVNGTFKLTGYTGS